MKRDGLLDVRQQVHQATDLLLVHAGRQTFAVGLVVVASQGDLLEVVRALQAGGGLADLLDGGQQQADQDGDDGDDHQQFDQSEGATGTRTRHQGSPEQPQGIWRKAPAPIMRHEKGYWGRALTLPWNMI